MATSAEIKASIDANITNKTLPGTIDNTLVGADVKAVVDYVDQEITTVTDSLSEAAISGSYLDLQDTPTLGTVASSNNYNDLDNRPTIVSKIEKITLTLGQVQALFTTPYSLNLNSTSGTLKFLTAVYLVRNTTTAYTLANDNFEIVNNAGASTGITIPCAVLGYAGTAYAFTTANYQSNAVGSVYEPGYKIKATVGNPTGGTGGLDVYVVYNEILTT